MADGVLGLDDFTRSRERRLWPGYDYVGWRRPPGPRPHVELEFEFEQLRTFRAMQVPHSVLEGGGGGRGAGGVVFGGGVVGWVLGSVVG